MVRDIRAVAMRLLATREHSRVELERKLIQRGYPPAQVSALSAELSAQALQSDARFAESYVHSRQQRGYGPLRIQRELRERGLSDAQIAEHLDPNDPDWLTHAQRVREKKFGRRQPSDYQDKLRQLRFLDYRGFTPQQMHRIIGSADDIA